jgi:hypothetical protein
MSEIAVLRRRVATLESEKRAMGEELAQALAALAGVEEDSTDTFEEMSIVRRDQGERKTAKVKGQGVKAAQNGKEKGGKEKGGKEKGGKEKGGEEKHGSGNSGKKGERGLGRENFQRQEWETHLRDSAEKKTALEKKRRRTVVSAGVSRSAEKPHRLRCGEKEPDVVGDDKLGQMHRLSGMPSPYEQRLRWDASSVNAVNAVNVSVRTSSASGSRTSSISGPAAQRRDSVPQRRESVSRVGGTRMGRCSSAQR